MDKQNKWHKYFIDIAYKTAELSYCERNKVGAIIVKDKRIISIGYNGTPSGDENICEEEISVCPYCESENYEKLDDFNYICYNCGGNFEMTGFKLVTKDSVIHAEQNALMFCAKNGISTKGCEMYITTSPCIDCAKLIAQAGIKKIYYKEDYRKLDGIILLEDLGIECQKIQ